MHTAERPRTRTRLTGLVAALAILATGFTTASNPITPVARAAEPKPAYATAVLEKIADGTGHGTTAQTFVNAANGFTPGDNTPDDGVVSSGDTVTYRLKLSFTAAQKRDVTVKWNLDNAPYLEGIADATGFCTPGQLVTARRNGGSCTFTVPAGAVETVQQTLTLRAKDTGGTVAKDQKPTLTVSRDGQTGGAVAYPVAPVTVVSAPAADLVIDNGGMRDNQYPAERTVTWQNSGTLTGRFTIRVRQLTYPGSTTTHGASTTGPWSAAIDVSRFPQGSTFTMDGENLPVKDGKVTVTGKTGPHDLNWTIPADRVKDMQENTTTSYDIQIIPDRTVFSTGKTDALLNMGEGGEPGTNQDRATDTGSAATGAISGYPYANNDWTRAIVKRYKTSTDTQIPPGTHWMPLWDKGLERPYTRGKTLFDPESLDFAKANDSRNVSHYGSGDQIASGTQVRTTLTMMPAGADLLDHGYHPYLIDTWDTSQQHWEGGLQVEQGGRNLRMGDIDQTGTDAQYRVKWTTDTLPATIPADPNKLTGVTWHDGIPADTQHDVTAIRIDINQNAIDLNDGASNIHVRFVTRVTATADKGNTTVKDTMTSGIYKTGAGWSQTSVPDYVTVVAPGTPSAAITNTVTVTDPAGRKREDGNAQPGDTATYTMGTAMNNIQLSGTRMTPTVTIPYPDGIIDPTVTTDQWKLTITGQGKDRKLTFTLTTPDGKTTPVPNEFAATGLPGITWTGRVSNLASGTVSAAATLKVDMDANGTVPAHPNVTSNTATASFTISGQSNESGLLTADREKAEINDPVSFTFNLYAKGTGRTGRSDTVIHMPSNQDSRLLGSNNTGLDGSWNEYDRGSSTYRGTYKLTEPVNVRTDNSTPTTVTYTTTVAWTDDPTDYQWKTWSQLTDTDKTRVTAIRVVSDFAGGTDASMPVAAASGTVTIHPADNAKDDQYNMWPGRTRFTDGHATGNLPWADRTTVAAGSIAGTVWWDRDENATLDTGEDRIPGITVTLWRTDDQGNKQGNPLDTTTTGDQGEYRFDGLHSGNYMTEVKRSDGTVTDTGIQTKAVTYYGQEKNVANTYSWNWMLRDNAKDTSNRIPLGIGQNQTRVDFGYAKPDPKATLDKTQTSLHCDNDSCTVNWDVKVTNNGKTTGKLPNGKTIETLSAGYQHSLALDSDGNAWAWGRGVDGELGDGKTNPLYKTSTPQKVTMPDGGVKFTQVSAGTKYSLALDEDGNAWAWGDGSKGQLGDSNGGDPRYRISTPQKVTMPSGVKFTQVSAGMYHSLALDTAGNAWAWGDGGYGQLGNNKTIQQLDPVKVTMPSGVKFTQVSAGRDYSLAVDTAGNAWAWGQGVNGQLGNNKTDDQQSTPVQVSMPDGGVKFTQVSAGYSHSLAVDTAGNAWAWGFGYYGQLGNNKTDNQESTPVQVSMPDGGVKFTQVSAGMYHSLAVDTAGNAWAWGNGGNGRLGNNGTVQQNTPAKVTMPDGGVRFTQLSAGMYHSLAVDTAGNAWAWGQGSSGQLGNNATTAQQLTPVGVQQGDTKYQTGATTPVDDSTPSTGTSTFPQSSTLSDRMSSIVENVSATVGTVNRTPDVFTRFTQISAGNAHSLALDVDGNAWAWGQGSSGQLGNKSTVQQNTPVEVVMPSGVKFTQISAGDSHSLALDVDGNAWAWGQGSSGQLGNNSTVQQNTPVKVVMPSGVKFTQVSAGGSHSLAIDSTGQAWAWGDGGAGRLGNNGTDNQLTPRKVTMPDGGVKFTQVSAGGNHSLALDTAGNAWAWGMGTSGQLGYGKDGLGVLSKPSNKTQPVEVVMPSGVKFTQVSAGGAYSLALDTAGNAWAWGNGFSGQLGNNSTVQQNTPVEVVMPSGVKFTQVSAGMYHVLALDVDGNAWAWGDGGAGRLGNNSTVQQNTPVEAVMPSGVKFTQVSAGRYHSHAVDQDGQTWAWGWGAEGELGNGNAPYTQLTLVKAVQTVPGVSTDPTAIPISPTSTSQADADTIRVYHLPYEVQPGGYVVYHFTGTIKRTDADRTVHNQAWFDSPDTPYAGTPNARAANATTPNAPVDANLDRSSTDITGNPTCMTGSDFKTPDMQHWFSTGAEDACDQVGATVPAYTTQPVLGSIGGLYWRDTNRDGVRQDDETERIEGQTVILEDTNGKQLQTAVTDAQGAYRFTDLALGSYRVRFSRVNRSDFTKPDANDQNPATDRSGTDSDAGTNEDDYGMGTPTVTLTDASREKTDVDAGVLPERAWSNSMPFTGGLLPLILLLGIGCMAGAILLLKRR